MKTYVNQPSVRYGWSFRHAQNSGFTLLELIIVLLVIAILSAIVAPAWVTFLNYRRVTVAQNQLLGAIRDTQNIAARQNRIWQISFRQTDQGVQWVSHPANQVPEEASWNSLDPGVRLDLEKNDKIENETTLQLSKGIYRIQFNHKGSTNGQLGRITLTTTNDDRKDGNKLRRCVIVSTLLGAVRLGEGRSRAENGKYCY